MWVSGLINPYGVPARVIEAVMSGQVVAVVSQQLLDELMAVLIRPKFRRWFSAADEASFVDALGAVAELRPDRGAPPRRARDPNDDCLVALAEAAETVMVTGDTDLLGDVPAAMTPRDLVDRLMRTSDDDP